MEDLKEELRELAEEVAKSLGFSVYDFSFSRRGRKRLLKVTIDKLEGYVSIKDCEAFSNSFGKALDTADIVPFPYDLVVESPGVERALRNMDEFKRFTGEKVKIVFNEPLNGNSTLSGKILSCGGKKIVVESADNQMEVVISFENVKRANLKL